MTISMNSTTVVENSVDSQNLTSNVTITPIVSWNGGSYAGDNPRYYIKVNGTQVKSGRANFNTSEATTGTQALSGASWTGNVQHNSDGTGSMTWEVGYEGIYADEGTYTTASGTKTLTPIEVIMANKYLDENGLLYFWQKIKNKFVAQETGKGLSTNDYTTAEKNKLSGIASGAQVNVIESVKVNGTAQTITSKAVNITVPTKTSDLTNDSNFVVDANYTHITVDASLSSSSTNPVQNKAINTALGNKAPLASPALTGTPTAPTAAAGTDSTQIATTAFVKNAVNTGMANVGGTVYYGTSSTAAGTAAKVANVSTNIPTTLTAGLMVCVTFSATNTAASPTLNVNSTGAKAIKYVNNGVLGNLKANGQVVKDVPLLFIYDGTNWVLTGENYDTTYSTMTQSEATTGTATTGKLITAKILTDTTNALIAAAMAGITGISFEVVTSLPTTGVNGTIYLIAHSHGTQDIYDEYIYVNNGWEKIGSTDIDLSGYMLKTDMVAITNSEIDTIVAA